MQVFYSCTDIFLCFTFFLLSRMRNLPVIPLQVPLLLSPKTTRMLVSSVHVPTPSAIHL